MILPSNVRNVAGTPNKTSHYYTYLPKPLTLDKQKWRVALLEVDFPATWVNLSDPVTRLEFNRIETDASGQRGRSNIGNVSLPSKNYVTSDELVETINATLRNHNLKSKVTKMFNERCMLELSTFEKITIHPTLAAMLGFEQHKFECHKDSSSQDFLFKVMTGSNEPCDNGSGCFGKQEFTNFLGTKSIDVQMSLYNIYIYSSLVDNTFVGNNLVPLLRTIPIQPGEHGKLVHREYILPHYLPLATGDLSVIEILLCDEAGNNVRFETGHVIVKLHFKRMLD